MNLPKKWCVQITTPQILDYTNKFGCNPPYIISNMYAHFPPYALGCTTSSVVKEGYTLISENDFNNFILENSDDKWYIRGNGDKDFKEYVNKKYSSNIAFTSLYCYFIKNNQLQYSMHIPEGYYEISIEQWKNKFLHHSNISGFKLIKKYPGCKHELGYTEPFTTGEFEQYPEFWEPQYISNYKCILIGDKSVETKVYKDYIIYDGMEIKFLFIEELIKPFESKSTIIDKNNYDLSFPEYSIRIGCTTFTKDEIELLFQTRKSL
jgi:hypothetical protein